MKLNILKIPSSWKTGIQTFGRSLLLPIAVLAPVGMVMGVAGALSQSYMLVRFPFLSNEILQIIIASLQTIASMIFSNIPLLFAMGVAYGMAKNEKGIAVFASVVSYLTLMVSMNVFLKITGNLASAADMANLGQGMVLGIQTLKIETIGGIIAGLIAAKACDRFYRIELPLAFAFFGGKKSVPIITIGLTIPVGFIIPIIWGVLTKFLISISFIFTTPVIGTGIYWTLHRALIPFGLHHVLASMIRFTEAGGVYVIDGVKYVGILPAVNQLLFILGPDSPYWTKLMPTLTSYLGGGQMLTTLFRIPAIGLAMYHTAFLKNKKIAKSVVLTCVLTAFLGNITEPMEFLFLFISPPLFILYCIMCGLGAMAYPLLGISVGYIRGTIFDFGIFGLLYDNTHWYNLVLLGAINFVVFYFVFRFVITKFNLETPGRESFELAEGSDELLKQKKWGEISAIVIDGLGGSKNLLKVENCISRLRIDLEDPSKVDKMRLKEAGCMGIFFPSDKHIHIVFGPHVEFVKNAITDSLKKGA
ncbi:MAG: PTS transporter subunit EIIC [Alphaproteobacteria bacterium]|jgi:PTS system maltose and glucose-specific IIC component|nr:PTS transporter subunit EIIC [Alphaproteobacteria bacterium]